jgi:flavin reductase (DIM6/NTAB) family NADH-FMN oxidoreductase RutF
MDRRTFFDIMGTAPAGVTVVTTLDAAGRPRGLTVGAVCSVSADPPSLLVSIDRRSRTLETLVERRAFAVNFLRGDRPEVGLRFASPAADRFAGLEWSPGRLGVPVLHADSLAWAECRIEQGIVSGDHMVIIAAVEDGSPPPPGSRPLMYFRHRFSAWAGAVDDPRAPCKAIVSDGPELRPGPGVAAPRRFRGDGPAVGLSGLSREPLVAETPS